MDTPHLPDEPGHDDLGDSRVRDLLTSLPPPGPMPDTLADAITAALAAEQQLRTAPPSRTPSGRTADPDTGGACVTPLAGPSRGRLAGRRSWVTALTAAAAVAAVGVVGTLVVKTLSPGAAPAATPANIHVKVSRETYQQDRFGLQARDLLAAPGTTPAAGGTPAQPLSTSSGIRSCLTGLGIGDATAVSVDLATFDGAPAAILVVTSGGTTTAYAVGRECSAQDAQVLEEGVRVP